MESSPTAPQKAKSPGLLSLWSLAVFCTWTVTSFLCHHFAKVFLRESGTGASPGNNPEFSAADFWRSTINAELLTSVQMVMCLLLVNVDHPDRGGNRLALARICHAISTLFTNISMACMFASSTFAIKLMEPITSAVVQYVMLAAPLSPLAILSLPVIVGGAIMFSGNPFTQSNLSFGIAAAFISNIILAFRNVSLKAGSSSQKQGGHSVTLRPLSYFTVAGAALCANGAGIAWMYGLISHQTIYIAATCALSGIFHVIYSYVSTGLVLLHMSVVSHAVTNILKRILVVLLLYMTGSRTASPTNFLGLVICTLGLLIYAKSKDSTTAHIKGVETPTVIQRMAAQMKTKWKYFVLSGLMVISIIGLSISKGFPGFQEPHTGIRSYAQRFDAFLPYSALLPNATGVIDKAQSRTVLKDQPYQAQSKGMLSNMANRSKRTLTTHKAPAERTFSNAAYDKPPREDLLPDMDGYLAPLAPDIKAFLQEDLLANPNRTSFLSKQLRTLPEIVNEAQRLHYDTMGKILAPFKYAMLMDIASFENKGDPCITVGETYFLSRINLEVVYYCNAELCTSGTINKAAQKARNYSPKELVILVHGGGNIVGYPTSDLHRFRMIQAFKNYQIFVFPQSIWVQNFNFTTPHFKRCVEEYCCNENITFVMRDHLSYKMAKEHFQGKNKKSNIILAPDMVFQIGPVKRFIAPVFDIMWIKRRDNETPGYNITAQPPPGIRIHVSDWWRWKTPYSPLKLEQAHYMCSNGFFYIQRGRVVITDRLHGHILATLLNIPHVLIDNKAHKLSAYHLSWTAGLDNTVMTSDPSKAVDLAMELLARYNSSLPPRVPFLHINERHGKPFLFDKVEDSYI